MEERERASSTKMTKKKSTKSQNQKRSIGLEPYR